MGGFLTHATFLLCFAVSLRAQEATPPPPDEKADKPVPAIVETADPAKSSAPADKSTPLKDSPGASATPAETNETVVEQPSLLPRESSGPAVLSRSFELTTLGSANLRFRPFLSISSIADDGLTSVTSANGAVNQQTDFGLDVGFGIAGTRQFRKDKLQLDFKGDVQRYNPNSSFDGGTYALNLAYTHLISRHMYLVLTEDAGYYANNYSLSTAATDLSSVNTSAINTPNTFLFNNATTNLNTAADLVIQKSARLTFDFGATGSETHRAARVLFGDVATQARADMTYRVTRRLTAGLFYNYTHYDFIHAFGGSNIHGTGFLTSYSLSKSLQLRMRLGGSRIYTTGVSVFTLDPIIAQVLGTSTGLIVTRHTNYAPEVSVQLFKTYRIGSASVEYINTVTPGNGLYLTSRRASYAGHYDYIGLRRWVFTAGAGRDRLSSLGVLTGNYTTTTARAGISRVLARSIHGNLVAEYRHYDNLGLGLPHNSYRVTLGVTWTPGEQPLKLW